MTDGASASVVVGLSSGSAPLVTPAPSGPDGFTVRYQLTSADIRSAAFVSARFSVIGNALGAFAFISGTIAVLVTGDAYSALIAILGLLWLAGLIPGLLVALMASRRPDLMKQPTEMTFNASGIRTVTPLTSGEAAWATYRRLRPTGSTLLFELGTGAAMLVPTRVFTADELERITLWADQAGVLDRSSPAGSYLKGLVIGGLAAVAIPALTWIGLSLGVIS